MDQAQKSSLAEALRAGDFITAPGVFDMLSAKLADRIGFKALYMTGSGTVASYLGLPDAGIATYTDMVARAGQIARGTKTPLIADADTGYGGHLNVRHTIQGYEAAGVAAIQMEDQDYPKKCGHLSGQKLIPADDMVTKIKVACDSRLSADTLIIARTDARKAVGFDEAMRRSEAYIRAGCDILFFEAPASDEEMQKVGETFGKDIPIMANMVDGGVTPVKTPTELQELGFRLAIFPAGGFLGALYGMDKVYRSLMENGTSVTDDAPLFSFAEYNDLLGFPEVVEFEERYDPAEAAE